MVLPVHNLLVIKKGENFGRQWDQRVELMRDIIIAKAGKTHLLVNDQENLMDGEPYVSPEGIFIMEINAIVPYIKDVYALYDAKVNVFRITAPLH